MTGEGSTGKTVLWFLGIVVAVFLLRSLYTVEPEMHDARKKWLVATELAENNDLSVLVSWDHHSSRWGVIFPAALAIKLNGQNLISYQALVLGLFALVFATLMMSIRQDIRTSLLFSFGVFLFYEPMFFRASTQMQPFVFGTFYILMSLLFLCRYLKTASMMVLGLSALFAFFAYGAKELYLFYVPGLMLILLWKSGFRACVYYSLWLLGFLLVETLVFNYLNDDLVFGRVEFLASGKHVAKMTGDIAFASSSKDLAAYYFSLPLPQRLVEFLFGKWLRMPLFDQVLVVVTSVYMLYLVFKRKLGELSNFSIGIIFLTISYSIFVSVVPLSIKPLIPLQPLWEKYLTPVVPFFVYIAFLMINHIVASLKPGATRNSVILINLFFGIVLVFSLAFRAPVSYVYKGQAYPAKDALFWKDKDLNRALESGMAVCSRRFWDLELTQVLLQLYMDEDGISKRTVRRKYDNIPLLHLKKTAFKDITAFIPFGDYESRISWEQCVEIRNQPKS